MARKRGIVVRSHDDRMPDGALDTERGSPEREVADALDQCGWGDRIIGVECEASPCVAVLHAGMSEWCVLLTCDAWTGRFGDALSAHSNVVECGDGERIEIAIVSPAPPGARKPEGGSALMEERWAAIGDAAECEPLE